MIVSRKKPPAPFEYDLDSRTGCCEEGQERGAKKVKFYDGSEDGSDDVSQTPSSILPTPLPRNVSAQISPAADSGVNVQQQAASPDTVQKMSIVDKERKLTDTPLVDASAHVLSINASLAVLEQR